MTTKAKRLEQWSVGQLGDTYDAPETRALVLRGRVDIGAGETKFVRTSAIRHVDGRLVRTNSGSLYQLGRIDPKYREWLRKEGKPYNPKKPITVK